MNNGVNQSLDIARYQKYTIDLNKTASGARGTSNSGDGAGVFDLRRSVKVQDRQPEKMCGALYRTTGDLQQVSSQKGSGRVNVRELAQARRDLIKEKLAASLHGKPSNNYNKPFEYIRTCLPGGSSNKHDSHRVSMDGIGASTKTR